jgi:hypothetical protein
MNKHSSSGIGSSTSGTSFSELVRKSRNTHTFQLAEDTLDVLDKTSHILDLAGDRRWSYLAFSKKAAGSVLPFNPAIFFRSIVV